MLEFPEGDIAIRQEIGQKSVKETYLLSEIKPFTRLDIFHYLGKWHEKEWNKFLSVFNYVKDFKKKCVGRRRMGRT